MMNLSARICSFVQAKVLGAFKLARFAYDRLQRQRVPPLWQDQIDLDMLTVQVSGHTYLRLLSSRPVNLRRCVQLALRTGLVFSSIPIGLMLNILLCRHL